MPSPDDGSLPRLGLRRVTVVLCLTEVTSWGVLFYAFPVLAPSIARETGWSVTSVVAAFTAGQLVAAGVGLLVGRSIQARGPRPVMTLGSAVGVAALVALAAADSLLLFTGAWLVVGAAMAATLYPPAFAALTVWGGSARIRSLTALTLVAGLASTVFAPLTALLDAQLGWRDTYLVLAAVLALTVPLHWFGLVAPWHPHGLPGGAGAHRDSATTAGPPVGGQASSAPGHPDRVWRTRAFGALVASMALVGFAISAVVILQVPLLIERGFTAQDAAVVLGVGGVGQVCGRLFYGHLARGLPVQPRTRLVFGSVAVTTLVLGLTPGPLGALVVVSFLVGGARGIYTLVQATAVADRWGTAHFATLNAAATVPLTVVAALAPWAATALADGLDSYVSTFVVLAVVASSSVLVVPRGHQDGPPAGPGVRRDASSP